MTTLPTLRQQVASLHEALIESLDALACLRRCQCDTLVPGAIEARSRMDALVVAIQRRLEREQTALGCAQMAAATYAHGIACAGRSGVLLRDAETKLLALLGGEPLPRGRLTAQEHAYVIAALAAREATGQEARAVTFETFIQARASLVETT